MKLRVKFTNPFNWLNVPRSIWLSIVSSFIVTYLFSSFCAWDLNPYSWSSAGRFFSFLFGIGMAICIYLWGYSRLDGDGKSFIDRIEERKRRRW